MNIEKLSFYNKENLLLLRQLLWPDCSTEVHNVEIDRTLSQREKFQAFISYNEQKEPVGFAEAALRDYVNGCESSPVAFLEGIFVLKKYRRKGIGAALVGEVMKWAEYKGVKELGSDALIDNEVSHRFHKSTGFVETEKVVYFKKSIRTDGA